MTEYHLGNAADPKVLSLFVHWKVDGMVTGLGRKRRLGADPTEEHNPDTTIHTT